LIGGVNGRQASGVLVGGSDQGMMRTPQEGNRMRRWLYVVVGVLLIAVGLLWTGQGLNILGGSSMSGVTTWAVVGPIVALVGVGAIVLGIRAGRRTT
jgi:sulfite exporter TauE/SafE